MAVRLIVIMSWVIIVMMWMPDAWFVGGCNAHECFNGAVCPETEATFGNKPWSKPWFPTAKASVQFVVNGLNDLGGSDYGWGNALAYLGIVPAWGALNAWLHRESRMWYAALVASVLVMFLIGQFGFSPADLEGPKEIGNAFSSRELAKYPNWFWYCTEWCMRIADATKITYGGVCFVVFVLGIPGVLIGDSIWAVWKRTQSAPTPE